MQPIYDAKSDDAGNPPSSTSKIIMMNMQGSDPSARSASNWKLTSFVEEHIDTSDSVPYVCILESWLKRHITDAQIAIPNYEIIRQDRKVRSGGGVLLYVHNSLHSF